MSRGHAKHYEGHYGLSMFGKDLVRRCSAHCELCDAQGVKLSVYEVPPVLTEPDYDHCIMICGTCQKQIMRPRLIDHNHWRCLNNSIWSEVVPVKMLSVAMLRYINQQHAWPGALLEQVYLDNDEEKWIEQIEIC
ncbi:phnA protein [Aliamphritea ceti]|uniref:phnA protein n=1 Tax=Aliamphritea ceti TaxID=1524258 RepID=UPI0021C3A7BD|nr:phnA protein [Aliamphritea ceti]